MWLHNETIIKTPRSMTINSVTYPRQIFNDSALLATLGITPYEMPVQLNQRYYWNNELPRDVDGLKEQMISTIKSQVGSRLKSTDWQVIRQMDGGTAMSTELKAYRAAIRTEGDAKEIEVNALVTLDDVMLYEATPFTEVRKIKHTSDEGVETYGPETDEPMTRHINLTMHFDAVDPLAEVDPAFVSLTENN
jgi:hypothetical protein